MNRRKRIRWPRDPRECRAHASASIVVDGKLSHFVCVYCGPRLEPKHEEDRG